jgi:hypothetical protein
LAHGNAPAAEHHTLFLSSGFEPGRQLTTGGKWHALGPACRTDVEKIG